MWGTRNCLSSIPTSYPPPAPSYPTTNGGMQNGSSVRTRTHCVRIYCTFGHRFATLSPCLLTKFLHRSSGEGLSRVRCWLGCSSFASHAAKAISGNKGRGRKEGGGGRRKGRIGEISALVFPRFFFPRSVLCLWVEFPTNTRTADGYFVGQIRR